MLIFSTKFDLNVANRFAWPNYMATVYADLRFILVWMTKSGSTLAGDILQGIKEIFLPCFSYRQSQRRR